MIIMPQHLKTSRRVDLIVLGIDILLGLAAIEGASRIFDKEPASLDALHLAPQAIHDVRCSAHAEPNLAQRRDRKRRAFAHGLQQSRLCERSRLRMAARCGFRYPVGPTTLVKS